jgi:hypothetical protein
MGARARAQTHGRRHSCQRAFACREFCCGRTTANELLDQLRSGVALGVEGDSGISLGTQLGQRMRWTHGRWRLTAIGGDRPSRELTGPVVWKFPSLEQQRCDGPVAGGGSGVSARAARKLGETTGHNHCAHSHVPSTSTRVHASLCHGCANRLQDRTVSGRRGDFQTDAGEFRISMPWPRNLSVAPPDSSMPFIRPRQGGTCNTALPVNRTGRPGGS